MVEVVEWPGVSGMTTTSPPQRANFARADDRRFGVVAALHEHVGPKRVDQLERRVFVEHDDRVDHRERRENIAALGAALRTGRSGPLSRLTDASLFTPTTSASPLRRAPSEHVDVPGMQQIEHAVREHRRRPRTSRATRARAPRS